MKIFKNAGSIIINQMSNFALYKIKNGERSHSYLRIPNYKSESGLFFNQNEYTKQKKLSKKATIISTIWNKKIIGIFDTKQSYQSNLLLHQAFSILYKSKYSRTYNMFSYLNSILLKINHYFGIKLHFLYISNLEVSVNKF